MTDSPATSQSPRSGAELAPQTLLENFKAALDEHAIVATTDARGRISYVNDKFCDISQYSREELIGQDHRLINSAHHSKEFFREMWQSIKSGRPWQAEIKNRAKDGSHYWVDTTIVPMLDVQGEPYEFIAIRTDITERKATELKLNERTRRIVQQNQELERANQLKSQFLANMSHELRTPLNAILGFSEALKDGLVGRLEPAQLDYVSEIFQSGGHLLSLINDILDLSKIEAGKMELELEPVELESLLHNALSIVREAAAKGRVELVRAIAPDLGAVMADGRKLRQIVYNLLSNAVKFTPAEGSVQLEASLVDDALEIAVTDTGIGMAENDLPRLFRPFEQLDGGIDRRFEGTGLGLAMVKSLVELHGGTLGVTSTPGRGSRFWFRLPRPIREQASSTPPSQPSAPRLVEPTPGHSALQAPRILVVDDDQGVRDVLRLYLTDAGFRVDTCARAREALRMIETEPPDLITLDLRMPDVDGMTFLGMLSRSETGRFVPVVVVTGGGDSHQVRALGASAVLEKPIRRHALLSIARALTKRPRQPTPPVLAQP